MKRYLSHATIKLVGKEEDISLSHFLSRLLSSPCPLFRVLLFFLPQSFLSGTFHAVAPAAIGQFKWLLTGSAGDLWLHLSLTWNPLPSGLFSTSPTHSILHPFTALSSLPLSVLCLQWDIISFSWLVCLLKCFFMSL